MKTDSMNGDREWLRSLGIDDDLIDSPSGNQMIRVIFGDAPDDGAACEEGMAKDNGFACVA